jgi:hypothetical protein
MKPLKLHRSGAYLPVRNLRETLVIQRQLITKTNRLNLMWFVDNIDEVLPEFQQRGIEIISPVKNYPYDLREFAFTDINGYCIRVAVGIEKE